MRRVPLLAVATLALVACFPGETITTTPEGEGNAKGGEKTAKVGDTILLSGSEEGLKMAVTVEHVYDPAEPKSSFDRPRRGTRLVAVELTLENRGTALYSDSPSNGAYLIDTQGQQFDTWISNVSDCQDLGSPRIASGDRRLGCVLFQVPEDALAERFQFTLDSGFGPETGEWRLS